VSRYQKKHSPTHTCLSWSSITPQHLGLSCLFSCQSHSLELCQILSGTRPSVQTVSDVCLGCICSLDTSAFSTLEVLNNNSHTHNHFTALWNLSGTTRVSRYQKKHSPTTLIMVINHPYLLSPSTTIHGILCIQSTCSTVFFHNLSPSFR